MLCTLTFRLLISENLSDPRLYGSARRTGSSLEQRGGRVRASHYMMVKG